MIKILLPVDGSELALAAVRHALRLAAEGLDASFVLANVQAPTYVYEMVLAPDAEVLERVSGAAGTHALEAAAALCDAAGVPYELERGVGDVAPLLVEIGERYACEAIVMGARGHGALRGGLLGSVSQALLHRAAVPVTLVKEPVDAQAAEEEAA
jgi:nucleotide-binding universal stress UspA family protein